MNNKPTKIERINASESLILSINENGLDGLIKTNSIEKLINYLDKSINNQIENSLISNNVDMRIKEGIQDLIDVVFTRSDLDVSSKEDMSNFMWNKTTRYLTCGFTQPYSSMDKGQYFDYESFDMERRRDVEGEVEEILLKLKDQHKSAIKASDFQELIYNCSPDSKIPKYMSSAVSRVTSKYDRFRDLTISVGGQIKLHAPKLGDIDSMVWHFDGDPMFIKIICFLSSQPAPDGSFCIRSNFRKNIYTGSHIKTILQSINWNETCKRIKLPSAKDYGIFLLSSHMPMLDKRGPRRQFSSNSFTEICDPAYFNAVVFKGVECLHKGGDNTRFGRPVFQGMASARRNSTIIF